MNPRLIPDASGIYRVTCVPTGDTYVGQATSMRSRCRGHACDIRSRFVKNRRWRRLVGQGYNEPDQYTFDVLEQCPKSELDEREMHWISTIRPTLNNQSPPGHTLACPDEVVSDHATPVVLDSEMRTRTPVQLTNEQRDQLRELCLIKLRRPIEVVAGEWVAERLAIEWRKHAK